MPAYLACARHIIKRSNVFPILSGQTVAAYQPPSTGPTETVNSKPHQSDGSNGRRYVAVALLQSGAIMAQFSYPTCSPQRTGFDLAGAMAEMRADSIVAANYFLVDQDDDFAGEFCRNSRL
jgi:hypothetical protein